MISCYHLYQSARRLHLAAIFILLISVKPSRASQAAGTETLVGIVGKDFVLLGADSSVSQSISLTASNLDKIAPLAEPRIYTPDTNGFSTCLHSQQAILAAAAGDSADSDRLVGLLQAHATMMEYQAGLGSDVDYVDGKDACSEHAPGGLTVHAMAHLARGQIASALRSRTPYKVCLLIAGMLAEKQDAKLVASSSFVSQKVQQQLHGVWPKSSKDESTSGDVEIAEPALPSATKTLVPRLFWLDEYGSLQSIQYGAHGYGSNFCLSILDQGYHPEMSLDEATRLLRDCFQQLRTRYVINSPQPPCIKCVDANGIRLIR